MPHNYTSIEQKTESKAAPKNAYSIWHAVIEDWALDPKEPRQQRGMTILCHDPSRTEAQMREVLTQRFGADRVISVSLS